MSLEKKRETSNRNQRQGSHLPRYLRDYINTQEHVWLLLASSEDSWCLCQLNGIVASVKSEEECVRRTGEHDLIEDARQTLDARIKTLVKEVITVPMKYESKLHIATTIRKEIWSLNVDDATYVDNSR